ncbi:hypothetical protein [Paenibacillus farraposensis]|nr:hypothetical protein [Paenibacillus farraposensis]
MPGSRLPACANKAYERQKSLEGLVIHLGFSLITAPYPDIQDNIELSTENGTTIYEGDLSGYSIHKTQFTYYENYGTIHLDTLTLIAEHCFDS